LREIMEIWYTDTPLGICGDEDGGAMSSWYVLTAMGFYPVTPGLPVYAIGSPIFEETRISLEKGKVFTITARNVSAKNKYIQSARLNAGPGDGIHTEYGMGQRAGGRAPFDVALTIWRLCMHHVAAAHVAERAL